MDLQDSQMETALLQSRLALLKIAFPFTHVLLIIFSSLVAFDDAMRDALSDLAGNPLPYIGLCFTLQQPSLAPSVSQSLSYSGAPLVSFVPIVYLPIQSWITLQDIDVPPRQCSLSRIVDEYSCDILLDSAPESRFSPLLCYSTCH